MRSEKSRNAVKYQAPTTLEHVVLISIPLATDFPTFSGTFGSRRKINVAIGRLKKTTGEG